MIPNFQSRACSTKVWKTINTGASIIWDYLFLEADNVTGFRERNSGKTVSFDDVYSLQMESVYT